MIKTVNIVPNTWLTLKSGNYFVEKEIGTGGFGSVYKVRKDPHVFALKLSRLWDLQPQEREEIRSRIKQEFEISHSVRSVNIVNTYFFDELEGNPLMIMDYCPDGSLRDQIKQTNSVEIVNEYATDILLGLRDLHAHNVIHRDVKPENILFKNSKALLTDFGISANLTNRLTQTNIRGHVSQVFASISYAPPEQSNKVLAFKSTGPTNDIFSFGVVMYELITRGFLPFGSLVDYERNSAKFHENKNKGIWNERALLNITGDTLWYRIIKKCMMPNPADRFQRADEIIQLIAPKLAAAAPPSQLANTADYKLEIINGENKGMVFNLTNLAKNKKKHILTLGRFDNENPTVNDIFIREGQSTYISLNHATIELIGKDNPVWILRDGQWCMKNGVQAWHPSTNGIFINNNRVSTTGTQINKNDVITIGRFSLRVI